MNAKKMFRWTVLIAAPILMPGLPAFACGDGGCACQIQAALDALTAIPPMPSGNYMFSDSSDMQILGDKEFVREALESSAARAQLGQLAQQKSQRDDIKEFSKQMSQDYGDLSEQVIGRVAKMLAVYDSKSLSKKDKELAKSLQGLSGPQFDEAYIKVITEAYRQDVKKFGKEATLALAPGVKVTAELGVSIASEHLKLLEKIAEDHDANRGAPVQSAGE